MASRSFTSLLVLSFSFCMFISSVAPSLLSAPPPLVPISTSPPPSALPRPPARAIKAAYWPSTSGFPASSIDTSYFTHIYYAFVLPEPTTYKLNITPFDQQNIPGFMAGIQTRNPTVKALLSIGGAGNDKAVFSPMAAGESTRTVFINSTIEVARKYGFDGVDLGWEFPANDEDMANLALLFQQWRQAIEIEANATGNCRLLLTSAVYYASKITLLGEPRKYPGEAIGKYLDWISPMCYDYHGSWANATGEHSALNDPFTNISTRFGIRSWIRAGVPPENIVMGMPLYGRTWKLQDPSLHGIGAPAVGAGPGGGILGYSQILDFNTQHNATVEFDKVSASFYSYAGDSWIGYDDVGSVKMKVRFARKRSLGGYFFWAIGLDKEWTLPREASDAWGY